tara:strand:- start:67 stop:399 length:333 start_codon:yes stop_codon:yes gene_type:complete
MVKDFGKKKFRKFAKDNRLRLVRSEDGLPIVKSRGKDIAGTHLFDGFGNHFVGLYIWRDTKFKMSHTYSKLVRLGYEPIAKAEQEATFRIPYKRVLKIAREFKMIKRRVL